MGKRALFGSLYAAIVVAVFGKFTFLAPWLLLFFTVFLVHECIQLLSKSGLHKTLILWIILPMGLAVKQSLEVPELLLFVFVSIWSSDTFAYLVGRAIGKTPLAPTISPNKTVEGALGGIVFTLLIGWGYARFFPVPEVSARELILYSGLVAIFAPLGDLLASWVKRRAKVKDSGVFLPGHGGAIDRLDSFLTASFAVLLLTYFI